MKPTFKIALFAAIVINSTAAFAQGQYQGNAVLATSYDVKCNGVTDDTIAINNALTATAGRELHFPAGICQYQGGGIVREGSVLVGAGRNATVIRATTPSARLFYMYGAGSGMRGFKFVAGVPQTGGSYVHLAAQETFIDDFYMTGDYNGILMTGSVSRIRHGRFQDGAQNAIRIRAEGGDTSQLIDDVLMGAQQPQISHAGIRVRNSSALIISNTSVIQQGYGLLVDPDTDSGSETEDGSVYSLTVHHSFFDNSGNNGIRISPSGNASVVRARFDSVWVGSSAGDGVWIANVGTGTLSGIHFTSPHLILNAGSGITTGGNVTDLAINGGEIVRNAHGAWFNPGLNGVRITDATIGAGAGEGGNTGIGIMIGSGVDHLILSNNDIRGNGGALVNHSQGSNQIIKNNFGTPNVGP